MSGSEGNFHFDEDSNLGSCRTLELLDRLSRDKIPSRINRQIFCPPLEYFYGAQAKQAIESEDSVGMMWAQILDFFCREICVEEVLLTF